MVVTDKFHLPSDEELTVPEVELTFPVLQAAAFHFGKYCENVNNEFMLCKQEEDDPRVCLDAGRAVTACTLDFFRKMKKHCSQEFNQYYNCIDKSTGSQDLSPCRKTQGVYDKCVLDNLQIERPAYGYFCEIKIHDSPRPQPKNEVVTYPDAAAPYDGKEAILPPKYGSRRILG